MEEQQWKGQSKGTALGYKIFIWSIKNLGLNFAYFLLFFVSFYYVLFSPKTTKEIYKFYRKATKFKPLKAAYYVWKNYFFLGQSLVDKAAIFSGLKHKFTLKKPYYDQLEKMIAQEKPILFIMSHVGNFDAAGFLVDLQKKVNLLMYEAELDQIKDVMDNLKADGGFKTFAIKYDGSHIFDLKKVMDNNEILCLHGDRFLEGTKTIKAPFFKEAAKFTYGPFYLAKRFKADAALVSLVKSGKKEYTLEFRKLHTEQNPEGIATDYAKNLEELVMKYPESWFNYHNFWA